MTPCHTPCHPSVGAEDAPCPWETLSRAPYVRANSGPETHRWETLADTVPVLAMARTYTSAVRVLESLAVFRGDDRVRIVFAFSDSTAFNAGTRELLDSHGVSLVPWAVRFCVRPRLVVTASENVDLTGFSCPVVVLPHGIGFQKYVPDHRTGERRVSGLPRTESHDADNVHLVLSHPAQLAQLRAERVPLADRAHVVGDPARDRLVAARRLRHHYRARLRVARDQRLVVLTSTWGPQGLFGTRPGLPARLLGALPHDDYRVAAVLHPNVWFAHSPWSVRRTLADALDSGLLLIPPDAGWGAAVVAADCLIGDHGSVTLYGASLDLPVLLGAFGEESVPDTAAAELARTAPRLTDTGLREQVEAAIDAHSPARYRRATDLAFAHPGRGGRRLAEFLYGRLGLGPRDGDGTDRALPVPVPDAAGGPPRAFEVHGWLEGDREIALERFPAAAPRTPAPVPGTVRHLSAFETETRNPLVTSASVVCRDTDAHADTRAWAEEILELLPGALMAAAGTGTGTTGTTGTSTTLVTVRDGRRFTVRSGAPLDTVLAAAVVYTLLRTSDQVAGACKVRVGSLPVDAVIEADPLTPPGTPAPTAP
ncbi:hypothetical protein AB0I72_12350 [Nocardiopsis sp. NPDC049922]|uniref:hypothetical protein n=1 Tax=Nocardiopsis sp. NPDC049922 TaxID=3155157 RepID=UPI0033E30370